MSDVTRILSAIEDGDPQAAEQLLPLVYDELRRLAARKMAQEKPGHTLDATALVHEAYVRLIDAEQGQSWDGRGHFFSAAAEAMRRILIENARRKKRLKHGGEFRRVGAEELNVVADAMEADAMEQDILAVNEALDDFTVIDPQAAQVVKLHFFAGLSLDEVAGLLEISVRSTYRDWAFARAWLAKQLGRTQS